MDHEEPQYALILSPKRSKEFVERYLHTVHEVFKSLDRFASLANGHDEMAMEFVHAVADTVRGFFTEAYGVDVCPLTELGPHEKVDLGQSWQVLSRMIRAHIQPPAPSDASPPSPHSGSRISSGAAENVGDITSLHQARRLSDEPRNGDHPASPEEIVASIQRSLKKLLVQSTHPSLDSGSPSATLGRLLA